MSTPTNDNENVPQAPDAPLGETQPIPRQPVPAPPQPPYGQYAPPAPTAQVPAQPASGAPYGQGAPGYAARPAPQPAPQPGAAFGLPPQPPAGPAPQASKRERRRPGWAALAVGVVAAAVLASAGTAGLVHAFDDTSATPASIATIGNDRSSGEETIPVSGSTSENPNWEAVTKTVSPSVVAISVTLSNGEAEGSGVVIDKDGHVLTNNHVVDGAQTVQVTLSDGRIYQAKIVGTDATTDLAVVKLQDPPDDLTPATLGDSSDVSVGESVLAVGNPLGLANTATTGIVSALNRPVSTSGSNGSDAVVTNAIQIDAAINPGNSGGPLFDAQGRVIGITSSIASLSGSSSGDAESGSIGLGFAIPSNLVKNISNQLIKNGTAEHAFLGVTLVDDTATADGVTRQGAKVTAVTDGSPASKAGLKVGDVIVAIDGTASPGAESLTGWVRAYNAGDVVKLTVVRDGKSQTVEVTLAVKEDASASSGSGSGDQGGSGQQGQGDGSGQQGQDGQQGGSGEDDPFGNFFGNGG